MENCQAKLERAEKLIGGLGGEKARWEEAAGKLAASQGAIAGDMLVCAAVISYLGAFLSAFRERVRVLGEM